MTTTPEAAPQAPRVDNPVPATEAYAVQVQAAAADIKVFDVPGLGRYCIQVSDTAFIYVDRAGLAAVATQSAEALA